MDKFPNEGIKIIGRLKNLIFEKGAITTRTDKIFKKDEKSSWQERENVI